MARRLMLGTTGSWRFTTRYIEHIHADPCWDYKELDAVHDVMIDDHETLVQLLLKL